MKLREVNIKEILEAREKRAENQWRMLERYNMPLISFTMNIAGPVKNDPWIERAFYEGIRRIESVLKGRRIEVLEDRISIAHTGCEKLWAVNAKAPELKRWMEMIEEQDELGRLFDIDVIQPDGSKISRNCERSCMICGGPVRVCARSRIHSADVIFQRTQEIIRHFFQKKHARAIGMMAEKALLFEVITTPKPGLVDCEDSGAHSDMDRFTFVSSACSLRAHFESCAQLGMSGSNQDIAMIFERLRHLGLLAEAEMYAATSGVNTHKGALFSLSLLCCAAGMGFGECFSMGLLLERSACLARESLADFEKINAETANTGGERQFIEKGLTGVRGEAASGFRSVVEIALPALEHALAEGKNLNDAGLTALIALMAEISDSNVLRRAGEEGQKMVWSEAKRMYCTSHEELSNLNQHYIEKNVSPGGSADLLTIAYFLKLVQESWL